MFVILILKLLSKIKQLKIRRNILRRKSKKIQIYFSKLNNKEELTEKDSNRKLSKKTHKTRHKANHKTEQKDKCD